MTEHTSLQISKELLKAGIEIDGKTYWLMYKKEWELWDYLDIISNFGENKQTIPAPTVNELLDRLPKTITRDKKHYMINIYYSTEWNVIYEYKPQDFITLTLETTLQDALGKMLIYLTKEGLIK